MVKKYHEKANAKKVWIVHSCGYDSIPTDIGTLFTSKQASQPCYSVESFMYLPGIKIFIKLLLTRLYFSSFASFLATGDFIDRVAFNMSSGTWNATLDLISNPLLLVDGNKGNFAQNLWNTLPYYHSSLKRWVFPFPSSDQTIVLRTFFLSKHVVSSKPHVPSFFRNHLALRSFSHLVTLVLVFAFFLVAVHIPPLKKILLSRKAEGEGLFLFPSFPFCFLLVFISFPFQIFSLYFDFGLRSCGGAP